MIIYSSSFILCLGILVSQVGRLLGDHFASQLYIETVRLEGNQGRDILVSPATLRGALGGIYAGVRGSAERSMRRVLELEGSSKTQVLHNLGEDNLNIETQAVTLRVANRIYISKHIEVRPSYLHNTLNLLGIAIDVIDFSDTLAIAHAINGFAEKYTDHKIRHVLPTNNWPSAINLAIVSTSYFRAQFASPFTKQFQMPFFYARDQEIQVNANKLKEKLLFGYLPHLQAAGLELPYKDSNLTLLILLPTDFNDNLTLLESQLANLDLLTINAKFRLQSVYLTLPSFRVESEEPHMDSILEKLGLGAIINGGADFGDLTESQPLAISLSHLRQKNYIEVTGESSEVVVSETLRLRTFNAPVFFTVNHPFIFVIKDPEHIYYVGRVFKPNQEFQETNNSSRKN